MKDETQKAGAHGPGTLGTPFTEDRRAIYLAALETTGIKITARREAGVTDTTVRNHRRKTEGFKEAEAEATRAYRARIEAEIHRRGIEGVEEPIYWQGEVVGHVIKYSDKLLELHAKRHIPEYRTQVKVDQTTVHAELPFKELESMSPESQRQLREILERERGRLDEDEKREE